MPANQVLAFDALLTKMERQISIEFEKASREFWKEMNDKLSAVKQPSDLAAVASELVKRASETTGGEDPWMKCGLIGSYPLLPLRGAWGIRISWRAIMRPERTWMIAALSRSGIASSGRS